MKAKAIVTILPLLLSCAGGDALAPSDYISQFGDAFSATLKGSNVSIGTDNLRLDMAFHYDSDGETKYFRILGAPLPMELRLSGSNETDAKNIKASLLGSYKNKKSGVLEIYDSPTNQLYKTNPSIGIYLENGIAYLDLTTIGVIVAGVNTTLLANNTIDSAIKTKSKYTLSEQNIADANEKLPLSQYFDDASKNVVDRLTELQTKLPNDFSYSSSGDDRMMSFALTSKDDVRLLFEDQEALSMSSLSLPTTDEILDRVDSISLKSSLHYTPSSLISVSMDMIFTFPETENPDDAFRPIGTWKMSGDFYFNVGDSYAPLTLADKEKSRYQELPEFHFDSENN